jgi:hypothetical protein
MLKRLTRSQDRRKPNRRSRDSGAAMIELAMTLGLLVTLLVGTVTAAIAFSQQNSIENAAREGSRFAATYPDEINSTWFQNVIDVTRAAGVGDLDTTVPGQFICVAWVSETGSPTSMRESGGVQTGPTPSSQCYPDGLGSNESRVQVVTGRDSEIQAVFLSVDLELRGQAAARYERG